MLGLGQGRENVLKMQTEGLEHSTPRATPHSSAPRVGTPVPGATGAGAGGWGLLAPLKCEVHISFQSDVAEADTPASVSVSFPENISCQETYLLRIHPLRPYFEQIIELWHVQSQETLNLGEGIRNGCIEQVGFGRIWKYKNKFLRQKWGRWMAQGL